MSLKGFIFMKYCIIIGNFIGIISAILVSVYGAMIAIYGNMEPVNEDLMFLSQPEVTDKVGIRSTVESTTDKLDRNHSSHHHLSYQPNIYDDNISGSLSSSDPLMVYEINGIEMVFLAMFTLLVAFIGFWGAMREHFLLLMIFSLILFVSLFLRIIFLLNYHVNDSALLWEQRFFGLLFAFCELILGIFSLRVAFIIKSGIHRTRSTRVLHYVHRSSDDDGGQIDTPHGLSMLGDVDLTTSVNEGKRVSFDF